MRADDSRNRHVFHHIFQKDFGVSPYDKKR
jgi:hypothetical protein